MVPSGELGGRRTCSMAVWGGSLASVGTLGTSGVDAMVGPSDSAARTTHGGYGVRMG